LIGCHILDDLIIKRTEKLLITQFVNVFSSRIFDKIKIEVSIKHNSNQLHSGIQKKYLPKVMGIDAVDATRE
jgi:hypothetical protein